MKSQFFNFKILKKDQKSKARVGQITTTHGVINTPCFIPVGTKATVRNLTPSDFKEERVGKGLVANKDKLRYNLAVMSNSVLNSWYYKTA